MTGIAVVASAHDAKFAEEVRAGLQAAGLDASVSQTLPKVAGPHVVLIWSAALAADHAIDAQALIGLWSEDRLVTVRRDATLLPLGLRDLPSLGPETNSKELVAAALAVTAERQVAPELKQLGRRYELIRVIGRSPMGIVYEGMDPKLHRKVAIKTILKGHMDDDEAAKEYSMRFMREAQAVARLNHPHIAQVYEVGEEGDLAYIVMEFVGGRDLKSVLDAKFRFELTEAVRIMCELLDALDFAHESGIVHRDVKRANVMLDGQGRVKLTGFGVARISDDRSAKDKAQAGTMFGGMAVMSPEQIAGGVVDRRCDIFLAGIILYELLTGEKPFTGSGAWTIAKKIIQDHPPVPSSINNAISPLFDIVVNKALSKTVEGRYQTAKEFAVALRRALEGRSNEDESDKTVVGSMGDLSSPSKPAAPIASAKGEGTKGGTVAGSQEMELEFWRAIKDGSDPDDFELYVQQFPTGIYAALAKRKIARLRGTARDDADAGELEEREIQDAAKREAEVKRDLADEKAKLEALLAAKEPEAAKRQAELKKEVADVREAKSPMGTFIVAIVAMALFGGGVWYYFNKASLEKQVALTAALETATKASQELQQAQARQQESLRALEEARSKEIAALKSGDAAQIKEAQEATKRAEAEATKQAEQVKARELAAADARKKAQDSVEKSKTTSKVPERTDPYPVAKAPEPVAKASEPAAKAPEPLAKSAEPPRAKSRSEREREEEDRLARVAASKKAPVAVASAPSASVEPASAASAPPQQAAELFQQAEAMEASDPRGAVRIYRSLARNGNAAAARRLGQIYERGIPGISRDYAESLQWYETARKLGEIVIAAPRAEPALPVRPPAPPVAAAIPEAAKPEPSKPAAVKSAPLPPPAPAALPEPPKAAAPAPAPVPLKPAAEPTTPEPKSGWFTWRGLLIALFVLALIAWRRSRRRQKAEERQAQRASAAAVDQKDAATMAEARISRRPQAAAQQAPPPGNATLFVSYSHKDRPRVDPIVSVIEEMGRRVWMDRSDITGQTGWAGQIVRAIRECRAVVLMASPNSYSSDQVVRELYLAMNHRKTIVPIEIEPAEMPDELQYILAPFQHHRLSAGETRAVLGRALAAV
jgi:serine/threonine-protein kinase